MVRKKMPPFWQFTKAHRRLLLQMNPEKQMRMLSLIQSSLERGVVSDFKSYFLAMLQNEIHRASQTQNMVHLIQALQPMLMQQPVQANQIFISPEQGGVPIYMGCLALCDNGDEKCSCLLFCPRTIDGPLVLECMGCGHLASQHERKGINVNLKILQQPDELSSRVSSGGPRSGCTTPTYVTPTVSEVGSDNSFNNLVNDMDSGSLFQENIDIAPNSPPATIQDFNLQYHMDNGRRDDGTAPMMEASQSRVLAKQKRKNLGYPLAPYSYCFDWQKPLLHRLTLYQRFLVEQSISNGALDWEDWTSDHLKNLERLSLVRTIECIESIIDRKCKQSNGCNSRIVLDKWRHANSGRRVREALMILDRPCSERNMHLDHKIPLLLAKISKDEIELIGPQLDLTNRVARQFGEDRVLRVSFDLSEHRESAFISLEKRYRTLMDRGIWIGGNKYEFLAYSASGLRTGRAYFFATEGPGLEPIKCDDVRNWMGNFDSITLLSKYAARLGQCFSRAQPTIVVRPEQLVEIPDVEKTVTVSVKGVRHETTYCFTDGCGEISLDLAEKIAQAYGIDSSEPPSVFQIRLGALKGVLAVNNKINNCIRYRPSMKKFDIPNPTETQLTVEVVKVSHCKRHATLNRQFIHILKAIGASDEYFLDTQQKVLDRMAACLEDTAQSMKMVQSFLSDDYSEDSKPAQLSHRLEAGHSMYEPFIMKMLESLRKDQYAALKSKAKVPVQNSRHYFGVCDQSDKLQYGQVFCQVSNSLGGAHTITGKVAVGKNPCVHPGDIRVLEAVDIPELRHLIDCIVFPVQGPRPHPNEIAGSDLDGDEFWICWDIDLVTHLSPFEPMHYIEATSGQVANAVPLLPADPSEAERHKRNATLLKNLKEYFFYYTRINKLGLIANLHCALADKFGATDVHCLQLAELHSRAVDAAKTGDNVEVPMALRAPLCGSKPHYMDADVLGEYMRVNEAEQIALGKKTDSLTLYHSKSVLGRMFDAVVNHERDHAQMRSQRVDEQVSSGRAMDEDLLISGRETYYQETKQVMGQYVAELMTVCKQYQDSLDIRNMHLDNAIWRYRRKFPFDKHGALLSDDERSKKASAFYQYTKELALNSGDTDGWIKQSFCWEVCGDVLDFIKGKALKRKRGDFSMPGTVAPGMLVMRSRRHRR